MLAVTNRAERACLIDNVTVQSAHSGFESACITGRLQEYKQGREDIDDQNIKGTRCGDALSGTPFNNRRYGNAGSGASQGSAEKGAKDEGNNHQRNSICNY